MSKKDADVGTMMERLMAELKKVGQGRDDDDVDDGGGRVPRARLQREIEKRREAEAKLEELAKGLEEVKSGYEAKLKTIQDQTAESVKGIAAKHAEDLALAGLGVSDELGRKAIRTAYETAPKETRGKSALEWWSKIGETQKAHLADPKKVEAPKVHPTLASYLDLPKAGNASPKAGNAPPKAGEQAGPIDMSSVPVDKGPQAFLDALRAMDS